MTDIYLHFVCNKKLLEQERRLIHMPVKYFSYEERITFLLGGLSPCLEWYMMISYNRLSAVKQFSLVFIVDWYKRIFKQSRQVCKYQSGKFPSGEFSCKKTNNERVTFILFSSYALSSD